MKKGTLFLLCIFLAGLLAAQNISFYVAKNGNDANSGSIGKPFASLQKAVDASRGVVGKKKVNIFIRTGTYHLAETIVISNVSCDLTISAYQQEKVILSGAKLLTDLRWIKDGEVYKAVLKNLQADQLFINNVLYHMARYPDYDSSARVFNGTAADAVSPAKVKSWKNPAGGYVHALHEGEWGGFHYKVTDKNSDTTLVLTGGWQNNRPSAMNKKHRFVENIFEELNTPGEWFYNDDTLYVIPFHHTDLSKAVVEGSQLNNLIEIKGEVNAPQKNVHIEHLVFTGTNRTFMLTKEPLLRSDWTIYRGGAILLSGTENCTVTNNIFEKLGGNAVFVSGYNKLARIEHNYIHHIGANAVAFAGNENAVRSPNNQYSQFTPFAEMDKTPGPKSNEFPQECFVTDNLVHDIGMIEKQVAGVEISMSRKITVDHNTIYNAPRSGINIGDGCWGGHLITSNDVFNTVLETGDHGAFNSWGRDRYWSADRHYMDSLVAVHPELILLDVTEPVTLFNNRFRCDHGWDIDLDDGSSNYHIYNNICLNGGLKLREGFFRTVENNIILNNSFHPHVWFANSHDIFRHNIVSTAYAPIGMNSWGDQVDYNFFLTEGGLTKARQDGTDKNSIYVSPEFSNAPNGDYTVKSNEALNSGFKNVPMNFGVTSEWLKQKAKPAPLPVLVGREERNKNSIVSWLGGKIKSVEGLGERSALGLPDEDGVQVIETGNGVLAASGLQKSDVIRQAGDKPVKNVADLMDAYQQNNWTGKLQLNIWRDQQLIPLTLLLK
ncbi:PDZ domain-containing protein [Danxiaibacter flavus]|uniref:PDZ domain-containing protein n=1 Tax=Danxiaibacter flavus TaxID=3049108 RepID=A0ABV3ZDE7_9BACT|nr:PDZ domain-containing protein [Chitinophagaceae bacterium DXS]